MKVNFYSPHGFEPWDHRSPDTTGIGGSETHVVEMSWRLAARGHEVEVFAPVPDDCPSEWRGTKWHHFSDVDPTEEATWILCRCPEALDLDFRGERWVVCQDVDYPGRWGEGRIAKADRIIALCQEHRRYLESIHPEFGDRVVVSSNAAKVELFEEIEKGVVERHPHRLIWTSSPDRGLVQAVLPLWGRITEVVPDAELHIYYGFDNMDRAIAKDPVGSRGFADVRDRFERLVEQPGVHYHGRVNQRELAEAWLSSSVWPYWSDFHETSCISSMEAQVAGVIPVSRRLWAVGENVRTGVFINGSCYDDPLTRVSLVGSTLRLLLSEEYQEAIRPMMMTEARDLFRWDGVVDQWEEMLEHPRQGTALYRRRDRFEFQRERCHDVGRVINIGCCDDHGNLRRDFGAVNVDINEFDQNCGWRNPVDVLADARNLPFGDGDFDAAVLGDILEHFDDEEAAKVIAEAGRVAHRLIITCPEDYRGKDLEERGVDDYGRPLIMYADKSYGYHPRPMTEERLRGLLGHFDEYEPLFWMDEPHLRGHGIVRMVGESDTKDVTAQ